MQTPIIVIIIIQIPSPRKLSFPSTQNVLLSPMFPRGLWLVHVVQHHRLHLRPLGNWSVQLRLQKRKVQSGTQLHRQFILTDLLPEVTSYPQGLAASLMEIRNARLGQTNGPFRPQHCLAEASRDVLQERAARASYEVSHKKCAKPLCSRSSCGPANFHEHPHPFPILFRCLPSSMKLGNKAFCPTLGFSISVPTDILNQIILCCGDPPVPCGIFRSVLKPYMLATSGNTYRVHNLVVTTKNISRHCPWGRKGTKLPSGKNRCTHSNFPHFVPWFYRLESHS